MKYLFVSDFDKTISIDDAGVILSSLLKIPRKTYEAKVAQLRKKSIVKHGGELSYLIVHDEDYRRKVTRSALKETGKRVRLKKHVQELFKILKTGIGEASFSIYVISAGPEEAVRTSLEKLIPKENVYGARFAYEKESICGIEHVTAGDAKADILDQIRKREQVPLDRVVYFGDGLSDMYVMSYIRSYGGHPVAVSRISRLSNICRKTIISSDALSYLVPVLENVLGFEHDKIKRFFEKQGFQIETWEKAKIEWIEPSKIPG